MDDKERPEELDKLSKAIIEALLSSENVREALEEVRQNNPKMDDSHMVLVLNMKGLVDGDAPDLEDADFPYNELEELEEELCYQIDGKILSPEEIDFHEHEAQSFNEQEWLKKIKVCFKQDDK